MDMNYTPPRYGRRDPIEYIQNSKLSPRTMDNFGSRSYQDIWVMTIKRFVGVWLTVAIVSAIALILPAILISPVVYLNMIFCMFFYTVFIVFVQAPLFWYTAAAYYKPEEYENYGKNWQWQ